MLIGILLAGVMSYAIPESSIQNYIAGCLSSMFVMLLIGIPLYIYASASTPLAASLIAKGMSQGTAFCIPACRPGNQCSNYNNGYPLPWGTFSSPLCVDDFSLCLSFRNSAGLDLSKNENRCKYNLRNCKIITSRRPEGNSCDFTSSINVIWNIPQGKGMRLLRVPLRLRNEITIVEVMEIKYHNAINPQE
jgi:hypothetical protein